MKLDEIPITIWAIIGGQFVAFAIAWGRALLDISNLKKDICTSKTENKEQNEKQNKTISAMYDKVSETREDVAQIKGMLSTRVGNKL